MLHNNLLKALNYFSVIVVKSQSKINSIYMLNSNKINKNVFLKNYNKVKNEKNNFVS